MIFQLCSGGDLKTYLQSHGPLDEFKAQEIFKQIADAVKLLNLSGIVHRDLKPANILITEDGRIKLADFGVARLFNSKVDKMMESYVGTPYYMAPEVAQGKSFNEKADLWSLGIILFEMIAGRVPFKGTTHHGILQLIEKG